MKKKNQKNHQRKENLDQLEHVENESHVGIALYSPPGHSSSPKLCSGAQLKVFVFHAKRYFFFVVPPQTMLLLLR